jgi:MoaA/NifB/PqqE/SkfB family radical SAM enzyme
MFAYEKIKTVQLEITNRCQAACPMCARNIHGGIDNDRVIESDLSLENFKKIFTLEFLNQLHQVDY